jgi:hypothetical protein
MCDKSLFVDLYNSRVFDTSPTTMSKLPNEYWTYYALCSGLDWLIADETYRFLVAHSTFPVPTPTSPRPGKFCD